jgi:hypothetical protein
VVLEEGDQVAGVLLLDREDVLHHLRGRGVPVVEPADDLLVAGHGDPLGDQVLADHVRCLPSYPPRPR